MDEDTRMPSPSILTPEAPDNSEGAAYSSIAQPNIEDTETSQHNHAENEDLSWNPANSGSTLPLNEEPESLPSIPSPEMSDSTDEPPAKMRRLSSPKAKIDREGMTCPICLEHWGTAGDHRIVSLKCGHLFGLSCVDRWLRHKQVKDRSCPTCKSKANKKDLRFIYASSIVAEDTMRITEMQKELDIIKEEKMQVELDLQKYKANEQKYLREIRELKYALMAKPEQRPHQRCKFSLEKNLELCKDGGCRVMAYNCRTQDIYVSQKSTNTLFSGYGIRPVNCESYDMGQLIFLHHKPIRDITYSQTRDLLLTVGLDNTARIVQRGHATASFKCDVPLWSVSWDFLRSDNFYAGAGGGVIHKYDIRNPSTYVQKFNNPSDLSPIVSLCSTEYGVLSCHLNSCSLWQENATWTRSAVPVSGPFMSLCYDHDTQKALVLTRPTTDRSKLSIFKLKPSATGVFCDHEQTFSISSKTSVMTRCAWVTVAGMPWATAHSESESALYLNSCDGRTKLCLASKEPVTDVCSVQISGDSFVAPLTDKRLRLYKAVPFLT